MRYLYSYLLEVQVEGQLPLIIRKLVDIILLITSMDNRAACSIAICPSKKRVRVREREEIGAHTRLDRIKETTMKTITGIYGQDKEKMREMGKGRSGHSTYQILPKSNRHRPRLGFF